MVEKQWFEPVDEQSRMYELHPENKLVVVNAIVRMTGDHFEAAAGRRVALKNAVSL